MNYTLDIGNNLTFLGILFLAVRYLLPLLGILLLIGVLIYMFRFVVRTLDLPNIGIENKYLYLVGILIAIIIILMSL